MRQWTTFGSGAVAAALFGTAALADMTAEQVWQDWQDLSASMGQSMQAANTDSSAGTLTVNGVTITSSEDDVTVTGTIDRIVFRERGDGTVEITMSERYPLTVVAPDESGAPVTMTMLITHEGLVMVASGAEGDVAYDISADTIALALEELTGTDDTPPVNLNLDAAGISGRYTIRESQDVNADLTADTVTMEINAEELDDGTAFAARISMAEVGITSAVAGMNLTELQDVGAALRGGFGFSANFAHGPAEYTLSGVDPESGATEIAGTADRGSLDMSMDQGGLRYATSATDLAMTFAADNLPFPTLAFSMQEATIGFGMPMLAAEEPQQFSLETRLVSLTLDDMLWNMFDPGNVLPRDPTTAIISLAGTLRVLSDLVNETASTGGDVPAEPIDVTLRELQLSAAGADLTGEGRFEFDNTDTVTFEGMPRPEGAVNLQLVGGNALVDRLVQLGYLPADQAMGARMMMGLFGRPGDGPDTLTSTIEVREDGGVYANGQRIQ